MVIQSEVKRLWWRIFSIGIIVDLVIAWAIVWWFDPDSSGKLLAITFVWLAIQVVSLLISIRGLLCAYAVFKFGQSQASEDNFLAALQDATVPRPAQVERSVESYLESVADNESLECAARIKAGSFLGGKLVIREALGFIRPMMIDAAHTHALKRYREKCRAT